eukprot:COSAG02_NODE_8931_length_2395_cov_2.478223_3_plen_71_part_00
MKECGDRRCVERSEKAKHRYQALEALSRSSLYAKPARRLVRKRKEERKAFGAPLSPRGAVAPFRVALMSQ